MAFDALDPFPSEDSVETADARAGAGGRQQPAPDVGPAAVGNLRTQLRQAEATLERLKHDADACRSNLKDLGDLGTRLAGEYTRSSDALRLTEQRSELAGDAVAALEKRLELVRDRISGTDARLASIGQLADDVMRRAADLEEKKRAIDQRVEEVTPVISLMTALEGRIAALAARAEVVTAAEAAVGHLERRAAEAAAHLERRIDDFEAQKRAIEHALDNATRVTDLLGALDARVATVKLTALSQPRAPRGARSRRAQHAWPSIGFRVAVLGAMVALLALAVMRWRNQPTDLANAAAVGQHGLRPPAAGSPLASRALASATATLPATPTASAIADMRITDPASDARAAEARGQSPAVLGIAAAVSGPVPSSRTLETSSPAQATRSTPNPLPQFAGDLTIESVPAGAAVFIDQKDAGRTPLQVRRLRAGTHVIRIEREGYDRWTTSALVVTEQRTRVSATLQPVCCPK